MQQQEQKLYGLMSEYDQMYKQLKEQKQINQRHYIKQKELELHKLRSLGYSRRLKSRERDYQNLQLLAKLNQVKNNNEIGFDDLLTYEAPEQKEFKPENNDILSGLMQNHIKKGRMNNQYSSKQNKYLDMSLPTFNQQNKFGQMQLPQPITPNAYSPRQQIVQNNPNSYLFQQNAQRVIMTPGVPQFQNQIRQRQNVDDHTDKIMYTIEKQNQLLQHLAMNLNQDNPDKIKTDILEHQLQSMKQKLENKNEEQKLNQVKQTEQIPAENLEEKIEKLLEKKFEEKKKTTKPPPNPLFGFPGMLGQGQQQLGSMIAPYIQNMLGQMQLQQPNQNSEQQFKNMPMFQNPLLQQQQQSSFADQKSMGLNPFLSFKTLIYDLILSCKN